MRLIILGTGNMAGEHARNFAQNPDVSIVAAVEPNQERLEQFSAAHGIPHRFPPVSTRPSRGAPSTLPPT